MELRTDGAGWRARAAIDDAGAAVRITLTTSTPAGQERTYSHLLHGRGHQDYLGLFAAFAEHFGTRAPGSRAIAPAAAEVAGLRALITRNLSPGILYGYGDPAVLRVGDLYHLVVTSNDAPQSFPLLSAHGLDEWHLSGFAFPQGAKPPWAATGDHAEYWAPELHAVGDSFLLCFAAREPDGKLCIGLATAKHPAGPFHPDPQPVLRGGVIDPHLHCDGEGRLILYWKQDSNDVWPSLLSGLLHERPELAEDLFTRGADVRTARIAGLLWPWVRTLPAMERFQAQQVLIEAAATDFPAFHSALERLRADGSGPVKTLDAMLAAMRTVIRAQPLDPATRTLAGTATVVLENNLAWEGHLVEGVWLWREDDACYLFYSANDFATADYGIGVARGTSPFGPFVKQPEPLLRAANGWYGLGHPSVARGPSGQPHLFFHGYRPDEIGYKAFRALLTATLRFEEGRVCIETEPLERTGPSASP